MRKSIIIFIILYFSQCGKYNNWEERYRDLEDKSLVGLEFLKPINEASKGYNLNEEENSIIGFFECICATCALNLTSWEEKLIELEKINGYSSFILLSKKTDKYIIDLIVKKKYVNIPVFLDENDSFKIKNNINFIDGDNVIVINTNKTIKSIIRIDI